MSYPNLDIEHLTVDQAKAIYKRDFWDRAKGGEYDGSITYQVFDAAINHGHGNAIRMLQRAAKVIDDGEIGKVTLAAINSMAISDVLMLFLSERLKFMTRLSTFPEYGAGWSNRIAANLAYSAQDNEV
jgi:lysozyme family protein